MNKLFLYSLMFLNDTTSTTTIDDTTSATESLKKIFISPTLYIVLGSIVLFFVLIYMIRRFVKAKPNTVIVIVKKGEIYKLLDENSPRCFIVPFVQKIGGTITLNEQELSTDELYINNGPDALYKINYTLKYRVTNPKGFYKYSENIQSLMIKKLNDDLREYADKGNALILVKDYRQHTEEILKVINDAVNEYCIESLSFKINRIEPLGRS